MYNREELIKNWIKEAKEIAVENYRTDNGDLVQKELERRGFLKTRDLKKENRGAYNKKVHLYILESLPEEAVECGFGGNWNNTIMIHPLTIEYVYTLADFWKWLEAKKKGLKIDKEEE